MIYKLNLNAFIITPLLLLKIFTDPISIIVYMQFFIMEVIHCIIIPAHNQNNYS